MMNCRNGQRVQRKDESTSPNCFSIPLRSRSQERVRGIVAYGCSIVIAQTILKPHLAPVPLKEAEIHFTIQQYLL